ncbi:hypothetical protein RFI_22877 [Reticulomyxa filosa]|uniref:Uncharacterized protein n=1 Tax=Reticulomyxa filosa TaxID=46433 RepID=X6MN26_RETFI|nr:hypothetical protein RFI_22877 [Reticulomyxa filosa]|eukprot:ETO14490.1 hypothetical protein RFI_22877 [Reticulomyxa filosa]
MTPEQFQELELLKAKRDTLKLELEGINRNWSKLKSGALNDPGIIPPDTQIFCTLSPNLDKQSLLLLIQTNNDTVIKTAILYGEKVFRNGSFMITPNPPKSNISLPLELTKDLTCQLSIKCIVGHLSSKQDHIFELSHTIPKFSSYLYVSAKASLALFSINLLLILLLFFSQKKKKKKKVSSNKNNKKTIQNPHFFLATYTKKTPSSWVKFKIRERIDRLILWLNQAFLLEYDSSPTQPIDIGFFSFRTKQHLVIQVTLDGQFTILTDDMRLAGDLVQDICSYLEITDLSSTSYFPHEYKQLEILFKDIQEYNSIRTHFSVDVASNSSLVKSLIVRSEDARKLQNIDSFLRYYTELYNLNQSMISEFHQREANHNSLLNALKAVNQMIEKSARLRMGPSQSKTIAMCREAVTNQDVNMLKKAMSIKFKANKKFAKDLKQNAIL